MPTASLLCRLSAVLVVLALISPKVFGVPSLRGEGKSNRRVLPSSSSRSISIGLSAVPVPLETLEWDDPGADWLNSLICRPSSASKVKTFCMTVSSLTAVTTECASNCLGDDGPRGSVAGYTCEVMAGTEVLLVRDRFACESGPADERFFRLCPRRPKALSHLSCGR